MVGGGLMDSEPEAALLAGGGDQDLAAALEAGGRFRIERVPATCGTCRKFQTAARVTYWPPAGGTARCVTGGCPDCGGVLMRYPMDAQEVICPACGQKVPLDITGRWD